ncbi:MAG: chemotaxis protein CheV [Magnetococcales bacterium]|nr:chemotaxis protein CheV [Magnetococcales bacterium]NGZ26648.1 chemotaxis protein CheV [Magnetococcales bacterium]
MENDKLMAEVDKRSRLAFSNEMEMLTFWLTDGQLYGLNVFKIIEILETPKQITKIPHSHPTIKGEIDFRGHPIALIDVSQFLGMEPTRYREVVSYVLVCEYSTSIQGFLVSQPNILITKNWDEIIKPSGVLYDSGFLTAITYHEGQPIQILDVEKMLDEIIGIDSRVSDDLVSQSKSLVRQEHHILAVDDSKAACRLIKHTLEQMGIRSTVVDNAPAALQLLESSVGTGSPCPYTMIFTDIEMPIMDGFTLTRKIKENPSLAKVYLSIHSSLSNRSNQEKAEQMGADNFIPKFTADNIVKVVLGEIQRADQQRTAITPSAR